MCAKVRLFRAVAPAFDVSVSIDEGVLLICWWIFLNTAGLEAFLAGVSGAAAQREDEVGGEGEQNRQARSGDMMVMRCRS